MTEGKVMINRQMAPAAFSSGNLREMKAVEIIVPFYGQYGRVTRLVESIFKSVWTNRYQLTLVDDGSENSSFIEDMEKAKISGLVCMRHDKNKGFGAAINTALQNPKHPWIPWVVILQSDVVCEDGNWLAALGTSLQRLKGQGVKMISPRTNNPLIGESVLKGERGKVAEDVILEQGYLPLYCALCHRDLFKHVGLFKEFPYAGCEAQEFAMRMRRNGFYQGVCGSSWVAHDGRATLDTLRENAQAQEILRNARDEFEKGLKK